MGGVRARRRGVKGPRRGVKVRPDALKGGGKALKGYGTKYTSTRRSKGEEKALKTKECR